MFPLSLLVDHEPDQMFLSRRFVHPIPKGLRPPAQGCRASEATLGTLAREPVNPNGVVPSPFLKTATDKLCKFTGRRTKISTKALLPEAFGLPTSTFHFVLAANVHSRRTVLH